MKNTIFFSWQSHEPRLNKNLIQESLRKAIKEVGRGLEYDESTRGIPGSPDIFNEILKKIDQCLIFVGDLTLIGETSNGKSPNPNVLIEYGYALSAIGSNRIIPVMNSDFGGPNELPFDLLTKVVRVKYSTKKQDNRSELKRSLQKNFEFQIKSILEKALFEDLSDESILVIEILLNQATNDDFMSGLSIKDFSDKFDFENATLENIFKELEHYELIKNFWAVNSSLPVQIRLCSKLFWKYGHLFFEWDPKRDAKEFIELMAENGNFNPMKFSEQTDWSNLRINTAMGFLIDHSCVEKSNEITHEFITSFLFNIDKVRVRKVFNN